MSHFPALFEFPPGQTLNLLAYETYACGTRGLFIERYECALHVFYVTYSLRAPIDSCVCSIVLVALGPHHVSKYGRHPTYGR